MRPSFTTCAAAAVAVVAAGEAAKAADEGVKVFAACAVAVVVDAVDVQGDVLDLRLPAAGREQHSGEHNHHDEFEHVGSNRESTNWGTTLNGNGLRRT